VSESYYGHPVVKPHVWTPYVPLYFWIGGTAGAASAQMLLSRVRGNHTLARVQKRIALAGAAIAPVLLIVDLGVPKRFLNMLRVFKATSPMSVGSWVLSAFGAVLAASTAAEFAGWRRVSVALEVLTAGLGPALATYTAVLLADTATPIWNAARRELPFVFVASGVAGAGALAVWFTPSSAAAPARRFMVGGAFAVFVTTEVMERRHRRSVRSGVRSSDCLPDGIAVRIASQRRWWLLPDCSNDMRFLQRENNRQSIRSMWWNRSAGASTSEPPFQLPERRNARTRAVERQLAFAAAVALHRDRAKKTAAFCSFCD
jgi:hypothetical protein